MQVNPVINALIDYCHGREAQRDDVSAVARFVAAHVSDRPAAGKPSRWSDVADLTNHAGHAGPNVTAAQIDAAVAAATDLAEPYRPSQPGWMGR